MAAISIDCTPMTALSADADQKIATCGNCPYAWKWPVGNWYTSRKYPICGEDFRHMRQHANSQPQWCPLRAEIKRDK